MDTKEKNKEKNWERMFNELKKEFEERKTELMQLVRKLENEKIQYCYYCPFKKFYDDNIAASLGGFFNG